MAKVKSPGHPFSDYTIVGSELEGCGITLNENATLSLISNDIKLKIVSEVGQALESQLSNIKNEQLRHFEHPLTKKRHITAYSSFGLQGVYYPIREIKELCALMYSGELTKLFLKSPENIEGVVQTVKDDMITQTEIGRPIEELSGKLDPCRDFNLTPQNYLHEHEKTKIESLEKWKNETIHVIYNELANMIQERRKQIEEATTVQLQSKFIEVLNDPHKGLEILLQVKGLLSTHITNQGVELDKKMKILQTESESLENEYTSISTDILDLSAGAIVPFRNKRVDKKTKHFLLICKDIFENKIEVVKLQEMRKFYSNIQAFLNETNDRHLDLKRKIKLVVESFNRKADDSKINLLSGQSKRGTDLFKVIGNTNEEVEFQYVRFQTPISLEHQFICTTGINHWYEFKSDEIENEIYLHSQEQYLNLNFDIGHVIGNIDDVIRQLFNDTHIAMRFTGQQYGFNHENSPLLYFLGVPEQLRQNIEDSALRVLPTRNLQVVPMLEQDKILMVVYRYCIPLMAMEPIVSIKENYEQNKDGEIPLHIFDIKNLPTIC